MFISMMSQVLRFYSFFRFIPNRKIWLSVIPVFGLLIAFQNCSNSFHSNGIDNSSVGNNSMVGDAKIAKFFNYSVNQIVFIGERAQINTYIKFNGLDSSIWAKNLVLKVQWLHNGTPLPGETQANFLRQAVNQADEGSYAVQVTIEDSQNADIPNQTFVLEAGNLSIKPQELPVEANSGDQSNYLKKLEIIEGETISLPLPYITSGGVKCRYFKDGVFLSEKSCYVTFKNTADLSDSGLYKIQIFNSVGLIEKFVSVVVNERFKPVFPNSTRIDNYFYKDENAFVFFDKPTGGGIQYRFFKNDTLITNPRKDPDFGERIILPIGPFSESSEAVYKIEAYNTKGSSFQTVNAFLKQISITAPIVYSGPIFQDTENYQLEDRKNFSIPGDFSFAKYRWYKDGIPIPGVTTRSFDKDFENLSDAGIYRGEAYNEAGSSFRDFKITLSPIPKGPPEIDRPPDKTNFSVSEGATIYLESGSYKYYDHTLKWFKDGHQIAMVEDYRLKVLNAGKEDSGNYRLVATNSYGSLNTDFKVVVNAPVSPAFPAVTIPEQKVVIGNGFTLNSNSSAGGLLKYRWYKDDQLLPYEVSNSLVKVSSTANDSGLYKLEAYNPSGNAFATFKVTIIPLSIPLFTLSGSSNLTQYEGGPLGIYRPRASGGQVKYRFYKDDVQIALAGNDIYTQNARLSDSGVYRVEAYNSLGSISKSFTVSIIPETKPVPDGIYSDNNTASFYVGAPLYFRPLTASGGGVKYRWYKDGIPIPGYYKSDITLDNAEKSDSGLYKMEAYNSAGVVSYSVTVLVLDQTIPRFEITNMSVNNPYTVGKNLSLYAGSVKGAEVKYRWYKDGELILGSTGNSIYLYINDEKMSGKYKVEAYNRAGSSFLEADVTAINP